jgi:transcriptional regulator with XRE-family HTH domain
MVKIYLAANLKSLLTRRGMRAADLSRKSGVSASVLCEWSAGRVPRALENLKSVAEALNTSLDALCFDPDGAEKPSEAEPAAPAYRFAFEVRVIDPSNAGDKEGGLPKSLYILGR